MNAPEQYDMRIDCIMSKIKDLHDREFVIHCGEWPPVWKPAMTEKRVSAFEKKHGVRLPEDYRRFITTIAAGGSQPFYGLESLSDRELELPNLGKPFPYTMEKPLIMIYLTEEEMDENEDDEEGEGGFIPLCEEGCGMYSMLVVNSKDPDTYGTVWFWDFANDFGAAPMKDAQTGQPFHFLDWLEYWADRTAALKDDEYFSFSDAVQMPEPPDNPDIMGRKMRFIE
ncbi:MAG: SMI1/KNR4 family protein [Lachnospiraceae bacterium]|nr:SMI1/KNR4 family protein [Lachnospiraceae bacterium]